MKRFQLKINIEGIEPSIWRSFVVNEHTTLEKLHEIIQLVMGWENYHLFEFKFGDKVFTVDRGGFNPAEGTLYKLKNNSDFLKMLEDADCGKNGGVLDIDKINDLIK